MIYSYHIPAETLDALEVARRKKGYRGRGPAALAILRTFRGRLAATALRAMPRTGPYQAEKWKRLAIEVDDEFQAEVVSAARATGIGRMRLVGVVLVSCQHRFARLLPAANHGRSR